MYKFYQYTVELPYKKVSDLIDGVEGDNGEKKDPVVDSTIKEFLEYKGYMNESNLDMIWENYSETQKEELDNIKPLPTDDIEINSGTTVYIENTKFKNELKFMTGQGLFLEQRDMTTFVSDLLKKIEGDENYTIPNTLKGEASKYDIEHIHNDIQVWCYIRSINKIIDITSFITNMSTDVSIGGGSFSLGLSPASDIDNNFYSNKDVLNFSTISYKKDDELRLNESWFVNNIQKNDIFFIKFEKLGLEKDRKRNELEISRSDIPNQIYDMIGLVDNVDFSYKSVINEMSVDINGRDVMKLLQEDGAYFFPFAFVQGAEERFFINFDDEKRGYKRLFSDGQFKYLSLLGFKKIKHALGFIFNQLTNTGVNTDNDLWGAYPNERLSKVYEVEGVDGEDLKLVEQNGIYQIVDLLVDKQLDDRTIANDGLSNPDGTLLEYVNQICQSPFVEFWGDTVADKYQFIARQPPFTQSQIKDYIGDEGFVGPLEFGENKRSSIIEIEGHRVNSINLSFSEEYYTWYQLKPENSFLGKSDFVFMAYFPAVLIPKYMEVFGNNRLVVSTNYVSYNALEGNGGDTNVNMFRKAAIQDLMYLIESTIYLPFTRQGSITIKGGDRRIKRGNWIYFKPTDEYFYVNSVSNNVRISKNDIDRETIVSVERGMKREFIEGKSVDLDEYQGSGVDVSVENAFSDDPPPAGDPGERFGDSFISNPTNSNKPRFTSRQINNVSYFNIINMDYVSKQLSQFGDGDAGAETVSFDSVINEDVMNFFLHKLQFQKRGTV